MTDRPVAPVLSAVAAACFVAAFSAAAVTRSENVTPSAVAAERAAPGASRETAQVTSLVTPSFSHVTALPALHLPKVHHHRHHHHAKKPVRVVVKPRVPAPTHVAVATPVPTAAPPVVRRPVTPAPRPTHPSSSGGYVGDSFDSQG
jgi:hypothetical protein